MSNQAHELAKRLVTFYVIRRDAPNRENPDPVFYVTKGAAALGRLDGKQERLPGTYTTLDQARTSVPNAEAGFGNDKLVCYPRNDEDPADIVETWY